MGRVSRIWVLWVGLAAILAAALPAFAVEATLVADAHVNSARVGVNSGTISNLNVGGGYTALLQFDLSMLPAGTAATQVSRATLRLYCNRADVAGQVSVQPVGGAWGEYSVTFATLPSLGSAVQVVSVTQAGAYVVADVTGLVQGWISGASANNGMALTAGSAVVQFDSKENDLTGHAAVLDVELASAGATGATGLTGPQGVAGPAGPAGAAGAVGPAGAPGLNFQGAYAAGSTYALDDVVTFSGSSFVSLTGGNRGNTPGVAAQWAVLAQGGTGGSSGGGTGLAYQGTYAATTNYALNDVVTFQGSSYVSLIVANHGNTPGLSPGEWGVLALGAVGIQGPPGVTGAQGPQGLTGSPGPTGAAGPTGATGAAGAAGSPGLVYQGTYSAGTNYALGDVVLFQGASYASLLNGNHGNTPSTSPGQWGVLTAQGPAGAPGAPGPQGVAGPQGLPGSVGPNGPAGPQGAQGIPGQAGAQGLTGAIGPQGLQGPMGPQGVAGPVGMAFRGAYSSAVNYALADGVVFNGSGYVSLVAGNQGNTPSLSPAQWELFATGTAGPQGVAGPAGPQGATGATGPQGVAGAQGTTGATGPQGPAVANFTGNYSSTTNYALHDAVSFGGSTYVSLVAGNVGNTPSSSPAQWALLVAQGAAGPAGATGATGPAGPTGATGVAGAVGPQGPPVSFLGGWLVGTAYSVGSAVSFGGSSYVALVANTGREPDISPTFWAVLSQAGAPGAAGAAGATGPQGPAGAVGVTYRGAWVASTAYHANDVVGFNGATYLAAATSLGSEPDVSPSLWAVLALNGSTGATGPSGAAATVSVGTVTTGAAGTQASVSNSGTSSAAVLNFTIPQGAAGANGTGSGGGGGTSGIPFASVFHSVSFDLLFHSVNSSTDATTETDSVLTWVPTGCTATQLSVFSRQTNTVNVILRQGTPGNMTNTSLACSVAPGASCTETGNVVVPAGNFVDFTVTGASGTASSMWVTLACN
jgi:Collagen triple helix repeat (20 copies)